MALTDAYKAGIDTNILAKVGVVNGIPVPVIATAFKDIADFINGIIGGSVAADYDSLLKIANKISSIETIIGQGVIDGDSLVDTITEILTVFATYPEGVDILTTINSKVNTTDVSNDLTVVLAGKVLDARQGKALYDMILARATSAELTNQINIVDATITALKNGSAETIASLDSKIGAITAIVGNSTPDGDAFVDTVAELLAVFSTYTEGVDLITLLAGKVNTTDILNVLTTVAGTTGKALDARQGKVLKDMIDAQGISLANKADLVAGKVPLTQIPIIPLSNMEPYNLTEHFGEGIESYDTGEVDDQEPPQPIYRLRVSDTYLQQKLFENIVLRKSSSWTGRHGETTLGVNNMQGATGYQITSTARIYTVGSFYGEVPKAGFVSQFTTAETSMGYRTSKTFVSFKQGFKMRMMMCVSDAAAVSTAKMFNGLSENYTGFGFGAGINPSGITGDAMLGYGNDGGDTNLSIIHGPAGGIIKTSLGANFPAQMQDFVYLEIDVLPNGTSATYRAFRISRTTGAQVGAEASGTLAAVPALTAEMALQFIRANGATALGVATDICFVAFEFPADQYLTGITL